jgi:hypothetical protein
MGAEYLKSNMRILANVRPNPNVVDMYLKDIHTSDTMGSMNYTRYPMINPSVSQLSSTELQDYKANGLVLEAPEYAGKIWVETIDGYSMLLKDQSLSLEPLLYHEN